MYLNTAPVITLATPSLVKPKHRMYLNNVENLMEAGADLGKT